MMYDPCMMYGFWMISVLNAPWILEILGLLTSEARAFVTVVLCKFEHTAKYI